MNAIDRQPVAQAPCVPTAPVTAGDSLQSLADYYRAHAGDWFIPRPPCPPGVDHILWDDACYEARKKAKFEFVRRGSFIEA